MHSCVRRTKINKVSIFWILYAFRRLSQDLLLNIELADEIHEQGQNVSVYMKTTILCRGQPNRGYKKPNPNPNISSMIFGSYNRNRIVQKGIRFLINRIPNIGFLCSVYKKPNSWFKPNYSFEPNIRIFVPNIDRIIRFNRIMSNFTGNLVISRCSATFF